MNKPWIIFIYYYSYLIIEKIRIRNDNNLLNIKHAIAVDDDNGDNVLFIFDNRFTFSLLLFFSSVSLFLFILDSIGFSYSSFV